MAAACECLARGRLGDTVIRHPRSNCWRSRSAWLALSIALAASSSARGQTYELRQTLLNPTPSVNEFFGNPLAALWADVLVSERADIVTGGGRAGVVHLFDPATGSILRSFRNPNGLPPDGFDAFGQSIAVVGGNVLVGAPADDTVGPNAGAAYLFDGATGQVLRTFHDPAPWNQSFGGAVAALGPNALIAGSEVVYLFDTGSGSLIRTFSPPSSSAFGYRSFFAEACGGVVVTAPDDDTAGPSSGAAYLFDASSGVILRTFLNPTPAPDDDFGYSVAAFGSSLLIGAPGDDAVAADGGALHRFDCSSGALLRTYLSPTPSDGETFGWSVALVDDNVLVGAARGGYSGSDGAAYLLDAGTGESLQTFKGLSPTVPRSFGTAVAAVGSAVAVGGAGAHDEGRVLLFDFCGSGVLTPPEQCDDGNNADGDGCTGACIDPCGNGVLDPPEQCDHGGESASCDADCTPASCGDGTRNATAGEECDDGNLIDNDTCSNACIDNCGNGVVDLGEECDDGAESPVCDADCTAALCADGTLNASAGEECEDGNLAGGDGCDAACVIEGARLLGTRLRVVERPSPPWRKVVFLSYDPEIEPPAPGSAGDPRSSGGTLRILNPATGEEDTFDLRRSGWTGLGTPAGSGGYRYSDPDFLNGPCEGVLIKPGVARARCVGPRIRLRLDEPGQGSLAVILKLGSSPPFCATFGGTVLRDKGTTVGRVGFGAFKAIDAPRAACPYP